MYFTWLSINVKFSVFKDTRQNGICIGQLLRFVVQTGIENNEAMDVTKNISNYLLFPGFINY